MDRLQRSLVILLAVGLVGSALAGCLTQDTTVDEGPDEEPAPRQEADDEEAVELVSPEGSVNMNAEADAAVVLEGQAVAQAGNLTELNVEVTKVEALTEDGEWVTLVEEDTTVNLLATADGDSTVLLEGANVDADAFTKVRYEVEQVTAVREDGERVELDLEESSFTATRDVRIQENATTGIFLGFNVDEALELEEDEGSFNVSRSSVHVQEDLDIQQFAHQESEQEIHQQAEGGDANQTAEQENEQDIDQDADGDEDRNRTQENGTEGDTTRDDGNETSEDRDRFDEEGNESESEENRTRDREDRDEFEEEGDEGEAEGNQTGYQGSDEEHQDDGSGDGSSGNGTASGNEGNETDEP